MSLFRKAEITVLKDGTESDEQLAQLKELEKRATGTLKDDIGKQIQYLEYGNAGEAEILYQLQYADLDMVVLQDLYIEHEGLMAQIDFYVITSKLNFIIECKNLYGNIKINDKGDFIRSYSYNGKTVKEGFPSPITQNERHLVVLNNADAARYGKVFGALTRLVNKRFTKSLVVLSNAKTIIDDRYAPEEIKNTVIRADNLATTIKACTAQVKQAGFSRKEMLTTGQSILSLHQVNKNSFVERYRPLVEQQEAERRKQEWICPECGKRLVKRNGKAGPFIGCTGYPQCHFTRTIYRYKENRNG